MSYHKISRRQFGRLTAASGLFVLTSRKGWGASTRKEQLRLRADVEFATVRPELHGHFAEHLGTCVYGGLWVGKKSPVENINGHRRLAVDYLRELGLVVLRWPGGCFADDYHWRDGIGPPEKRPRTVNIHWGNYTEDNSFGTHEFIELCRLLKAEPYLAGNVGSGTPQELRDWVEYCNYPSGSTLSDERIANGAAEPFRVRYWGVGNENWGCGGQMTAEEYAAEYRRFATYVRSYGGTRPFMIACGPNSNDVDWTRRFLVSMGRRRLPEGYAMHFYLNGKSPATKFTPETLQDQMASFIRMEQAVVQQRALLDGYDPDRRCGLLVDEWGVWDRMDPEEEKRYGRLWQQNTIRCGVAAALGLNVFHRQAEKLVMCNLAQTVNVLQALLLADGNRCIRTPTYYAYLLMKEHRGATAVRTEPSSPPASTVSVSASRREKQLTVTFVNPTHDTTAELDCPVTGGGVASAKARILHHADMNACNTYEAPDTVVPRNHPVEAVKTGLRLVVPPLSVVTVEATLG